MGDLTKSYNETCMCQTSFSLLIAILTLSRRIVVGKATEDKPASYWANSLDHDPPTQDMYLHLRPVINANGRKWMLEFVEAQGLRKMLESGIKAHFDFKDDNASLSCMQCLEGFMNNKAGLQFVLEDPQAIQDIAMFFHVPSIEVKSIVLKLLTVLAWMSDATGPDGYVLHIWVEYLQT